MRQSERRRTAINAAVVMLFGLLVGCTSTSLVEKWQEPGFQGPALQKLLVVSVQRSDGRRRIWEDAMISALAKQGVNATASYKLFADAVPERAALSEAARRDGYDGVLIAHQLGRRSRSYYTPGKTTYEPVVVPTLDGQYVQYWQAIYEPGYSEIEQQVDYQIDLFATAAGGRLIWTATTRSVDLSSAGSITTDITRRILPELVKIGAIAGKSR